MVMEVLKFHLFLFLKLLIYIFLWRLKESYEQSINYTTVSFSLFNRKLHYIFSFSLFQELTPSLQSRNYTTHSPSSFLIENYTLSLFQSCLSLSSYNLLVNQETTLFPSFNPFSFFFMATDTETGSVPVESASMESAPAAERAPKKRVLLIGDIYDVKEVIKVLKRNYNCKEEDIECVHEE